MDPSMQPLFGEMYKYMYSSSHTHILTYTTSLTSYTKHACRHAICIKSHTHIHTTHAYTLTSVALIVDVL